VSRQHAWPPTRGPQVCSAPRLPRHRSRDVAVSFVCPRSRADPLVLSPAVLVMSCGPAPGTIFAPGPVGQLAAYPVPGMIWQPLCVTAGGLDHRRSSAGQARVKDGDRRRRRPSRAAMPGGGSLARPPACCGSIRAVAMHVPGKGPAKHGRSGRPDLQRWVHRPPRAGSSQAHTVSGAGGRRMVQAGGHHGAPAAAVPAPPSLASATRHRRPCPAGFAGPGPAWQRPGRRSHEHR
jgi:hypothetical protein